MDPKEENNCEDEPEENPVLDEIETKLAMEVIQDCITKLEIIGNTLPIPPIPADTREYQSLEERFGRDLVQIRESRATKTDPNMIKLQKERALFEYILKGTLAELKSSNSFNFLNDKVIQYMQEHKEEKKLLKELAEYGLTAPGLKRELASSKARTQEELSQNLKKLAVLQDKVAAVKNETKIRQAFLANWEEARVEQVNLALQLKEKKLIDELKKIDEDTNNELQVHAELGMALERAIDKVNKLRAEWDQKYVRDLEEKKSQLEKIEKMRSDNLESLKNLADLYQQHKKELREWQEFCLQRQLALEKLQHETAMATKIQAWWRGTMVRNGLGPYKKKKGPPKGAKKK